MTPLVSWTLCALGAVHHSRVRADCRETDPVEPNRGVEPICTVLTEHGCPIAQTTYYAALARARTPSARERRDEVLKVEIGRVYGENYRLYGARKVRLGSTARASRSLAARSSG